MTISQPTTELTAEQVEQYERDGFVVLESVFGDDELTAMRAEADRILELVVNCMIATGELHPRTDVIPYDDGTVTIRKVQPVNDLSELIASISTDPRLITPMAQLMGDEPWLMEEKLNYKQWIDTSTVGSDVFRKSPRVDDSFPVHHDWGFYNQQGYPSNTMSSAVALDDCAGRGPIKVIPGSHTDDPPLINPDPAAGDGRIVVGHYGPERVVIDAPAGSVMLFHAKLVHDSEPNTSKLPRRMMIYSHYPASHGGDPDRRNRWLREKGQAVEEHYRALVASGQYTDQFRL